MAPGAPRRPERVASRAPAESSEAVAREPAEVEPGQRDRRSDRHRRNQRHGRGDRHRRSDRTGDCTGGIKGTGGSTGTGGVKGTGGRSGPAGAGSGGAGGSAAPTFTQVYTTILVIYCSGSSCHNPGSQKDVSFASQSSAYSAVKSRVTAGNGAGSSFYMTVNSGSMPPGPKLSAANLALIKAWIDAGALNN